MLQDLENMTKELGGLFKGLFKLGSKMIQSETLVEESEDWEDESDDDWDDDELNNILSLLDEDDSDEESSDDESLENLLNQFTDGLGGALEELGDTLAKELGSLGSELDTLGSEAANALDENAEGIQDILRELGQWLINIADEANTASAEEELEEEEQEEVVVMQFRPKDPPMEILEDEVEPDSNETSVEHDSSYTIETSVEPDTSDTNETSDEIDLEDDKQMDISKNETIENVDSSLPISSALKRLTKAKLVEMGVEFGLDLSMKQTKQTMLDAFETIR